MARRLLKDRCQCSVSKSALQRQASPHLSILAGGAVDKPDPPWYLGRVDHRARHRPMNVSIVNPPNAAHIVMVKEGRCMQRREAWGYVMAPVTMVTMATLLRDGGHAVSVIDAAADEADIEAVLERVTGSAPDLVLINSSTPTIDDDLRFAGILKRRTAGRAVTALFGIHPTVMHADLLQREPGLDFCVVGEPELTARKLADALEAGGDGTAVPGLAWLDGSEVRRSPPRPFIADLDSLPIPDWSFVDPARIPAAVRRPAVSAGEHEPGLPVPLRLLQRARLLRPQAPAPQRRPHHARAAPGRRALRRAGLHDLAEEFILDKEFVVALADAIIRDRLPIRWVCNSRTDAPDRRVLKKIRDAGCWNIAYGIESGVQSILDRTRKGIMLAQTREAVASAREAGLKVTGHVILGLPGETDGTMAETHRFVKGSIWTTSSTTAPCRTPAPSSTTRP